MKIVKQIQLKIAIFTAVKNLCILHGRVFVMFCLVSYFVSRLCGSFRLSCRSCEHLLVSSINIMQDGLSNMS